MKTTPRFSSDLFKWRGNHGLADIVDLPVVKAPHIFEIVSERTGAVQTFELDQNAAGYEDGWDGEMWVYTNNLWDKVKVVILNNWK